MNTHTFLRRISVFALLGLAVIVIAACGSDSPDTANRSEPAAVRSYVGAAQGSGAFVGVVVDGERALTYVCDGVPGDPVGAPPTVQAWFNGPLKGDVVDVSEPGGRLELRVRKDDVTGTVSLADGRRLPVAARVVKGDAGLYRAEASVTDGKLVAGWILSSDGQQRGGLGVESGGTTKLSGTGPLILSQPTISLQGLASARIAKVGITPIPIP